MTEYEELRKEVLSLVDDPNTSSLLMAIALSNIMIADRLNGIKEIIDDDWNGITGE